MNKLLNQKQSIEYNLYNNILYLSRNKLFYTKFNIADTFQNRINLMFFHISFIFIKFNLTKKKNDSKNFEQKLFDLTFKQIELNMRELGYGDISVNRNMKFLVKTFYNILTFCQKYTNKSEKSKITFFEENLRFNSNKKTVFNKNIINYFNNFKTFCFDLSLDSVLKGELKFTFK